MNTREWFKSFDTAHGKVLAIVRCILVHNMMTGKSETETVLAAEMSFEHGKSTTAAWEYHGLEAFEQFDKLDAAWAEAVASYAFEQYTKFHEQQAAAAASMAMGAAQGRA